MIITTDRCMIRSQNSNAIYWEQGMYPEWTAISTFSGGFQQTRGTGVEPHYHDNDEIWLFTAGRGEVWLDGERFDVTPNTAVYTPMGVVHRFQMFTDYENNALVTRLERQKRPTHILVEEDGPPVPTVAGFVIPGERNTGPFPDPGSRCPLSELRHVVFVAGSELAETHLPCHEHWCVLEGSVQLSVDGLEVELSPGDVALLRAGTVRRMGAQTRARVVLVRER